MEIYAVQKMPVEIDCPYCRSKAGERCTPRNVFIRWHSARWKAVGINKPTPDHLVQCSHKMTEMNPRPKIGTWGIPDGLLPEISEAYGNND